MHKNVFATSLSFSFSVVSFETLATSKSCEQHGLITEQAVSAVKRELQKPKKPGTDHRMYISQIYLLENTNLICLASEIANVL